ncbi:YbaN family protein [Euzebya sp.]|uniref:YbaN family protein n=1 Tax=Euzebya sp. TaxID=1971409 RepID=UPI0035181534
MQLQGPADPDVDRGRSPLVRGLWIALGLLCVAVGGIGVVVPGLPSTVFFIGAAACFTRSSPRLEAWVLNLPGVGQTVADFRAGRGMPRRAKVIAITSIVVFGGAGAVFGLTTPVARGVLAVLCAIGIIAVLRVPTRVDQA